MILGHIFERNALHYPRHPAIRFEGRTITHAELLARIRRLINALAAQGLGPQDRIAILSQNCPEYVELHGAAAIGGFVAAGLNYRLSAREQSEILRDCEPSVFVFESQYAARAAELRPALPPQARLLCIGEPPSWAQGYEALVSAAPDSEPTLRAREEDVVFLIYTSGTTGRAKGVMLGNEGQIEQSRAQALMQIPQQNDRKLIVMPFYHIGGPTELLTYLLAGATIVLHRAFDAPRILRSIQDERVTAAHLAPTMIEMMLAVQEKTPYDISSLHTICYASAPMSVALSRRAIAVFGRIFMQIYGMTEHGPGAALLKHEHLPDGTAEDARRLASAGHAIFGTDIRIVREDGGDCGVGEVGEVWMRSKAMMQGYWRNPAATAEAIGAGWMRSGDMGYFDDERFLFIVDRKKDMIISGGENIYSREVEEALLLHPSVNEAAVIGVPDATWGESVKAFVSLKAGARASEAELIEHCRSMIASYKKPRTVEVLEALPRISSTNKIDKRKLRQPFWDTMDRQVS